MKKDNLIKILSDVNSEIVKQDEKWGSDRDIQSIPSGMHTDRFRNYTLMIPTEENAKSMCELAGNSGKITWSHIALEEFCEVVSANNAYSRREELIQLTAVLFQWIDNIDRNLKK